MKEAIYIIFLAIAAVGCSQEVPRLPEKVAVNCEPTLNVSQSVKSQTNKVDDIKVVDWGPQSTIVGVNPNIQPGGGIGLWIRVSGFKSEDELSISFDGKPALVTNLDGDLITASFDADLIKNAGKKEVLITRANKNDSLFIGTFNVEGKGK